MPIRSIQQYLHITNSATMTVLVLADSRLYARWLIQAIIRLWWHPLLRVNAGVLFGLQGRARWRGHVCLRRCPQVQV